ERSEAIIAVSQFTASQMEALLKIPAERIRVVPHGVHIPQPTQAKRAKLVLFVGAIQRRKNIARLVRAFEQLPADWRLILAGASDGYGAEAELQSIEQSARR